MNPTGKVFTAAELAFIAELVQRHDCYAICDEVYEHLTFDGWKHIPLMTLPGMRERCMRIGSAGKTFSLTGWKVGYITATAALAANVAKAHQNLTFTTAAQPAARRGGRAGARTTPISPASPAHLQAKRDRLADGPGRARLRRAAGAGQLFHHHRFPPAWASTATTWPFCRAHHRAGQGDRDPGHRLLRRADAPSHYARFAFCKGEAVIDAALARMRAWVESRGRQLTAAAG